jgi:hypothetical protein
MSRDRAKKRSAPDQEVPEPEEEQAFPRGGGDKHLTPLEKRQLTQQATEDFQAEQKSGKKAKKAKASGGKVGRRPPRGAAHCSRRCCAGGRPPWLHGQLCRRPVCSQHDPRIPTAQPQLISGACPPATPAHFGPPSASRQRAGRAPPRRRRMGKAPPRHPAPLRSLQDAEDEFFATGDLAGKSERFVELLKYKVGGSMGTPGPGRRCCSRGLSSGAGTSGRGPQAGFPAALWLNAGPSPAPSALSPRPRRQTLAVGMKLWGMVLEVTPKALVVSLPQGLRGSVAPEEVRRASGCCDGRCGVFDEGVEAAPRQRARASCALQGKAQRRCRRLVEGTKWVGNCEQLPCSCPQFPPAVTCGGGPLPLSTHRWAPAPPPSNRPQASDALRQMLDPESKPGATLRKGLPSRRPPALPELFSIGQYVRCAVIGLGGGEDGAGGGKRGGVRLSLRLKRVCEGLGPDALAAGRCVPAVVRTAEDHVYTLAFGIKVRMGGWEQGVGLGCGLGGRLGRGRRGAGAAQRA